MNRHSACTSLRRRGLTLLDLLVTLVIVSIMLTVVMQLMYTMLRTTRDIANSERQATLIDRTVRQLRHDVLRAGTLSATADQWQLGETKWRTDGDTLVRQDAEGEQRFGPMPMLPTLTIEGRAVRVSLGEAVWLMRPLELEGAAQ